MVMSATCKTSLLLVHASSPSYQRMRAKGEWTPLEPSSPWPRGSRQERAGVLRLVRWDRQEEQLNSLSVLQKKKKQNTHTGGTIPHCVGGGAPELLSAKGTSGGYPAATTVWIPPENLKPNSGE